jgi:hypothetical protein
MGCLGCVGCFLGSDTAQVELRSGRVSAPARQLPPLLVRCCLSTRSPSVYSWFKWRRLNLKAQVESSILHCSFKRSVPGGFNLGFTGSTCISLPGPAGL